MFQLKPPLQLKFLPLFTNYASMVAVTGGLYDTVRDGVRPAVGRRPRHSQTIRRRPQRHRRLRCRHGRRQSIWCWRWRGQGIGGRRLRPAGLVLSVSNERRDFLTTSLTGLAQTLSTQGLPVFYAKYTASAYRRIIRFPEPSVAFLQFSRDLQTS